jgi:diguanylate cyclase (GGDEF)-like protein
MRCRHKLTPPHESGPILAPARIRCFRRKLTGFCSLDVFSLVVVNGFIVIKASCWGWSALDPLWLVLITLLLLMVVHARTERVHSALRARLDGAVGREAALRAELAEANTDYLTGLPMRRSIYRHLDGAPPDTELTVVFVDADGLKAINDRLGHGAGDEFLVAIAGRLSAVCVPGDVLVRLGGDEFAFATTQTAGVIDAALTSALHAPVVIAGHLMPLLVSVGIVRSVGGDAHTALGCAEAAMRTAKRQRSFVEHYRADRDGIPFRHGVRPTIRLRDQQPERPAGP